MRHIHPVTDDELIRALEADMIGLQWLRKFAWFLQHHRDAQPPGASLEHEIPNECQRSPGFQNIVDEKNVPPQDVVVEIAQQADLTG